MKKTLVNKLLKGVVILMWIGAILVLPQLLSDYHLVSFLAGWAYCAALLTLSILSIVSTKE